MEHIITSLEIALKNETTERDFYLQQAHRTKNTLGKKMFERIAADEDDHIEKLRRMHQLLSEKGAWPESVSETVSGVSVMDVLNSLASQNDSDAPCDDDDRAALQKAVDFEQKGFAFYTRLSSAAASSGEKEFFSLLARMEHDHLLSLKETLLFFDDPASWFAQREKPTLEG